LYPSDREAWAGKFRASSILLCKAYCNYVKAAFLANLSPTPDNPTGEF